MEEAIDYTAINELKVIDSEYSNHKDFKLLTKNYLSWLSKHIRDFIEDDPESANNFIKPFIDDFYKLPYHFLENDYSCRRHFDNIMAHYKINIHDILFFDSPKCFKERNRLIYQDFDIKKNETKLNKLFFYIAVLDREYNNIKIGITDTPYLRSKELISQYKRKILYFEYWKHKQSANLEMHFKRCNSKRNSEFFDISYFDELRNNTIKCFGKSKVTAVNKDFLGKTSEVLQ